MLGRLCNQTVNLKTDPKTMYYSALKLKYSPSILKHNKGEKKYESSNNSHNNFHRNYTNGMFLQIKTFRSMDRSLRPTGCIYHELLCILGDFCVSGTQDAEATKSLIEVVGRVGCTHPSLDIGQGFQY